MCENPASTGKVYLSGVNTGDSFTAENEERMNVTAVVRRRRYSQ